MQLTRLHLAIMLTAAALLGAYWAVNAQEGRPIWAPPPVLPPDDVAPKKASVKYPLVTQPMHEKAKADPTLIIPAEVYEKPHAQTGHVTEETPGILQTGGVNPPPMFPPLPIAPEDKGPAPLPIMPVNEPKLPAPPPEPTKVLIVDPPSKDAPKPATLVMPTPVVLPESQPTPSLPTPIVTTPPPTPALPTPTVTTPLPAPTMPTPSATFTQPAPSSGPKSFLRIRSTANESPLPNAGAPAAVPTPIELTNERQLSPGPLAGPTPVGASGTSNLQTPNVTVEKRGPVSIRANEGQSYQLVIRNLGPVPAQQIRIEDELPANVKLVSADPMPQMDGNKAIWVLSALNVNQEQIVRLSLQTAADTELPSRTSVQVSATNHATTVTTLRPQNTVSALAIQLQGPAQAVIGKPAIFEIRVANQSNRPLTNIVLHGSLPEGFNTNEGREIEGAVDGSILPGEAKTLKMPATAMKAGRFTVSVKVTTNAGEASAMTSVEVGSPSLFLQQAPTTRLLMGRDGDLRLEIANHTARSLRNVAVADQLPEGIEYIMASDRGLYQANSRTVHWLIDSMPPGQTKTLALRVHGTKTGQYANVTTIRADGIAPVQSTGTITLDGLADLSLRVSERDKLVEAGREAVYEIQIANSGNMPASNVQLQVQFPPGLMPKNAEGNTRYSIDRQTVVFEPIASLNPGGQAIYRVTAQAQAVGDQRVRFAVVSEQVRTPIQREISTLVVRD